MKHLKALAALLLMAALAAVAVTPARANVLIHIDKPTQTMTVTVRALATRELTAANVVRVVLRETAVGLINGFAFAALLALLAFFWFGTDALAAIIAIAMVVNLLAAALAGIYIPLFLERMGFDPAVASTVFVTTVTDVVGFFSFLGLATLWLM